MKNSSLVWSIVAVAVVIIALVAWHPKATVPTTPPATTTTTSSISYACDAGKSISSTESDSGVTLTLSDGRVLALTQATSASGVRYINTGDTIEFWNKGDSAFLQENGATTYDNCLAGSNTTAGNGLTTFTDQGKTFSFQHPATIAVTGGGAGYSTDWMQNNNDQTAGLILAKATIDKSSQPSTNFSEAKFTVGTSSDPKAVKDCLVSQNGNNPATTQVTINGIAYTKITGSDAGAGNFYDTTSYRTVRNNQCYAVEYTIHSTNIGNYDPSQGIKEFDKAAVVNTLEGMVQSFKFL